MRMTTLPMLTVWWVDAAVNLVVSLVVFAAGYLLVYRKQLGPQLRKIEADLQDRAARFAASQADSALEIAKAVEAWHSEATRYYESPGDSSLLPNPTDVHDHSRLANDPELRDLLAKAAHLTQIVRRTKPSPWINVVHSIDSDEELVQELGPVWYTPGNEDLDLTPAQADYLRPIRADWERERREWGESAESLRTVAKKLRDRAEVLLRTSP